MRFTRFLSAMMFTILLCSYQAAAFSEDGFHTGMTRDQAEGLAKSRGLEVREFIPNSFMMGRGFDDPATAEMHGSVGFCNDSLVGYARPNEDLDGRLIPDVEEMLARHGQPQRVRIVPTPVLGGGYIRQISIDWYLGDDRIELTVVPEQKDQQGGTLAERHVSLYYASKSPCTDPDKW